MTGTSVHQPDWSHFRKNKDRLEKDAEGVCESGVLTGMGVPPGNGQLVIARALVTIIDKNPGVVNGHLKPNGKPLSASEKRKQRRYEADRKPDEVIRINLEEGDPDKGGFKIIKNEDYIQPPSHTYTKDGKEMPSDWVPVEYTGTSATSSLGADKTNSDGDDNNGATEQETG